MQRRLRVNVELQALAPFKLLKVPDICGRVFHIPFFKQRFQTHARILPCLSKAAPEQLLQFPIGALLSLSISLGPCILHALLLFGGAHFRGKQRTNKLAACDPVAPGAAAPMTVAVIVVALGLQIRRFVFPVGAFTAVYYINYYIYLMTCVTSRTLC